MDTPPGTTEALHMEANSDTNDRLPAAHVRVAFFSDSLPERNGTGAYYHDLASQLTPQVEALEVFQPLQEVRYPRLSLPMPGDPMQRLIAPNVFRIARGYKALKPKVVIAVTPGPFGLLGLYHARRSGARFITAFHTDFEHLARIYWSKYSRWFVNGYLRNANKFLCHRSATVLINNSNLRPDVEKLGAPSVEVMGTPLQRSFLARPIKPPPAKIHRICFAGRLAPEKNIDRIVQAARELPQVEFIIGGDGPLRRELEDSAKGLHNLRFSGWMNREELIDMIDSSSLLLLPSKVETFGSVALEAMARGRPAVVSSNAGIHDWPGLREGLIAYDQSTSLTDTLRPLLDLPSEHWQQKAFAARCAAEQLNRNTIGQWAEVLAKYASPPEAGHTRYPQ
ncbi:glycosyltransferase [Coraliomargarita parva]|uniref:glycosyltransferase n=1 Tax=Coraliomargarita parva TaxID=3014050 RepID=UPI0022B3FE1B|nr:glycosyltransferase [Coraliomargarita parva]